MLRIHRFLRGINFFWNRWGARQATRQPHDWSSQRLGLLAFLLVLLISSCRQPVLTAAVEAISPAKNPIAATDSIRSGNRQPLWQDSFATDDWRSRWQIRKQGDWGWENASAIADPSQRFSRILRVRYPAGSASPNAARTSGAPLGGLQFYANLGIAPRDSLRLSYDVRLSENFDFVKGGKLPGLFGGTAVSGGKIPNGTNGFSSRFMWRKLGRGEIYAYLPTSDEYGTSIGRGSWQFTPGTWQHLEQKIDLNQIGKSNGRVQVWLDGEKVLDKTDLNFRTTKRLQIEGIFFSTFFGGSDLSWATPRDVYVDFANFAVFPA